MDKFSLVMIGLLMLGLIGIGFGAVNDASRRDWIANCVLSQPAGNSRVSLKDICWAMERQR